MPAFLLISGYLINVHKKPEIFLKAMAWIFIPYTIMEISYACMSMLFPVWDGIKEINASVLLGKVLLDPIGPYWYYVAPPIISCILISVRLHLSAYW